MYIVVPRVGTFEIEILRDERFDRSEDKMAARKLLGRLVDDG